jgi:hypothetical protein
VIAIGCLLLVVLPILGLVLGGLFGGHNGAKWAALIGLGIAVTVCGLSGYALVEVSRRR